MHRALGYSLTGDCREECFFVTWGEGGNGKGTVMNTVAWVIGEYADDLPFSALEMRDRSSIPADIAKLVGKRFVTASESGEAMQLNEARIKALTGRDPITARLLHKNFFTFQPVAKFWLATNAKPVVRDDSDGFWRRVHLIPFTQSFAGRADQTLKDRLRDEAGGILAWLVRGALAWQRDGLNPPQVVRAATDEYRRESEPLTPFIQACCVVTPKARVQASHLFGAYRTWCDECRIDAKERLNQTSFGRHMKKRFPAEEGRNTFYVGVGLRDERHEPPKSDI
jgi:putative DNA primase/helicase